MPTLSGLYRVAGGSRSPARPEVAAPARKEPSWSGREDTASCSRPGHRLHLSGQPSPDGGSGHCSHWERRGSLRPGPSNLSPPAPPTGRLSPGRGPGSAGSISRGRPAHFRPPPTPAPPTAGIRAPRGMAGGPRSSRPARAPRPLVAPPPAPFRPGAVRQAPAWRLPATSWLDPAWSRLCPRVTASREAGAREQALEGASRLLPRLGAPSG